MNDWLCPYCLASLPDPREEPRFCCGEYGQADRVEEDDECGLVAIPEPTGGRTV